MKCERKRHNGKADNENDEYSRAVAGVFDLKAFAASFTGVCEFQKSVK